MKTLYILRHGKSSWTNPELDDFDRPLLPKGEKRTERIAFYMQKNGLLPELIITSPAVRAKHTATIIADLSGTKIVVDNRLYPGHSKSFIDVASEQNDSVNSLMIVGHNPGITDFVNEYLGAGIDWLPTSGLAGATFDMDSWIDIPYAAFIDEFVITPKSLI